MVIVAGSRTKGTGPTKAATKLAYEADLVDPDAAWIQLSYAVNAVPVDQRVRLTST